MTKVTTLRKAGGSISVTLPKAMADRLNVAAGDQMFLVETEHGILMTPYDPDFQESVEAFDQVRKQYRNTLRKLGQ